MSSDPFHDRMMQLKGELSSWADILLDLSFSAAIITAIIYVWRIMP
jgi:hypothetical protein